MGGLGEGFIPEMGGGGFEGGGFVAPPMVGGGDVGGGFNWDAVPNVPTPEMQFAPPPQAGPGSEPTAPPPPQPTPPPASSQLDRAREAIARIESRGSGDYNAMGPRTRTGDQAHGRYQVMGNNVGPWTQQHFGQRLTPEQFRANPAAQDAVFNGQFGSYLNRYGNPQDAASAWFTGQPLAIGGNRTDATPGGYRGISGNTYVDRFMAGMNRPAQFAGPGAPGSPAPLTHPPMAAGNHTLQGITGFGPPTAPFSPPPGAPQPPPLTPPPNFQTSVGRGVGMGGEAPPNSLPPVPSIAPPAASADKGSMQTVPPRGGDLPPLPPHLQGINMRPNGAPIPYADGTFPGDHSRPAFSPPPLDTGPHDFTSAPPAPNSQYPSWQQGNTTFAPAPEGRNPPWQGGPNQPMIPPQGTFAPGGPGAPAARFTQPPLPPNNIVPAQDATSLANIDGRSIARPPSGPASYADLNAVMGRNLGGRPADTSTILDQMNLPPQTTTPSTAPPTGNNGTQYAMDDPSRQFPGKTWQQRLADASRGAVGVGNAFNRARPPSVAIASSDAPDLSKLLQGQRPPNKPSTNFFGEPRRVAGRRRPDSVFT